jgi:hypothetical protein
MWKPKWLGVTPASIVIDLQIGHSGRKDMFARLIRREHDALGHRIDAVTGPVMETACSGMNLHHWSILLTSSTRHKKLTDGASQMA